MSDAIRSLQKRLGAKKDYFAAFRDCPHASRICYMTRQKVVEYFQETGNFIANAISPFSIHISVSLFDRYMSYLAEHGTPEIKETAAQEIEVGKKGKEFLMGRDFSFNNLKRSKSLSNGYDFLLSGYQRSLFASRIKS